MFFVFSKDKIASYVVAFSTVAVLFTMSIMAGREDSMEASTNYTEENIKTYNNMKNDYNDVKDKNRNNSLQ